MMQIANKTDKEQKNVLLSAEHLSKTFQAGSHQIKAVDDLSFSLHRGEILALVGESGSGKSTVARLITGIERLDRGTVEICGNVWTDHMRGRAWKKQLRHLRCHMQMIFQNAEGSFHPGMRIREALLESIHNFHENVDCGQAQDLMNTYMEMVGLPTELAERFPWQLSGGQCQRAAIVRALAAEPDILICDEATSALDVLVQARIMELLKNLQAKTGMSLLFISHDLSLVSCISDRILIMQKGRCVEQGETEKILKAPESSYTRLLLDSIL